jgi:hypothetical protein
MPGPALIFAAPALGGGLALKKRAENRRKQAAANKYSQKYPLSDDLGTNSSTITAAQSELRGLNASPARTAGAKRVKNREISELSKWIGVLTAHGKDLKAGMAVATSTSVVQVPSPAAPAVMAPTPTPILDGAAPGTAADNAAPAPEIGTTEGPNAPTGEAEGGKKTNWLLIAGVAVGAVLLLNFMKKN